MADDFVLQPVGSKQDELGADDLGIGRGVATCGGLEVLALLDREYDDVGARLGHVHLSE